MPKFTFISCNHLHFLSLIDNNEKNQFFFTSLLPTGTVPVINFTTNGFQILKFMLQIMLGEVKKFNCMFREHLCQLLVEYVCTVCTVYSCLCTLLYHSDTYLALCTQHL